MKRFFPLLIAVFTLHSFAFAQCPDTSITTPGFHPPADSLPSIDRGTVYDETVQINIPEGFDTMIGTLTLHITIDSIHLYNITGQPSGISYACLPLNCTIMGASAGCITFYGTTTATVGQYPLTINVISYTQTPLGPRVDTLDIGSLGFTYYLTVSDSGVFIKSVKQDLNFSIYPNPGEGVFTITLSDNAGKPNDIGVYDLNGKMVFHETFNGSVQKQLDLSDLPKGIYTLRINSEKSAGVQKLVIR